MNCIVHFAGRHSLISEAVSNTNVPRIFILWSNGETSHERLVVHRGCTTPVLEWKVSFRIKLYAKPKENVMIIKRMNKRKQSSVYMI